MKNSELIAIYKSVQATEDLLLTQIKARNIGWQHLVEYGMQVEAMRSYRQQHDCSLREAHDAVQAFRTELKVQCLMNMSPAARDMYLNQG